MLSAGGGDDIVEIRVNIIKTTLYTLTPPPRGEVADVAVKVEDEEQAAKTKTGYLHGFPFFRAGVCGGGGSNSCRGGRGGVCFLRALETDSCAVGVSVCSLFFAVFNNII